MSRTSIFKPDGVGHKREFHTDQETYETLKAVNTKTTALLDVCILWRNDSTFLINNLRLLCEFLGI